MIHQIEGRRYWTPRKWNRVALTQMPGRYLEVKHSSLQHSRRAHRGAVGWFYLSEARHAIFSVGGHHYMSKPRNGEVKPASVRVRVRVKRNKPRHFSKILVRMRSQRRSTMGR